MDITQYTTCDEVRALLGVSSDEIEDGTILLEVYATGLEADLRGISPQLMAEYASSTAATPPSDNQTWLVKSVRAFAALSLAKQLCPSLPMFAPKDISDGKANISRWASSPYEVTIDAVTARFSVLRDQVSTALDVVLASASSGPVSARPYFFGVKLSTNPVTGA